MKYMGSKNRIAKYILPIMLENYKGKNFYDLFCGGGNLIDKVPKTYNRYANDLSEATIMALIMIRDNLRNIPKNNKEFTEEDYNNCKQEVKNGKITSLNSFAGFAYSYGAKYYDCWRRDKIGKRDYVAESYRNAVKQSPYLHNVIFSCASYDKVFLEPNSLIYCDIPYKGTGKYKTENLNYEAFWDWCREKKIEGHTIYISEYNAPEDFKCVWQKEINSSLTRDTGGKKGIEKLFTL